MLSDDLKALWDNLANHYTDNPAGMFLKPEDFQALMGTVWEIYQTSLHLEAQIPPPPPKIEGENIVNFKQLQERKTQRRM